MNFRWVGVTASSSSADTVALPVPVGVDVEVAEVDDVEVGDEVLDDVELDDVELDDVGDGSPVKAGASASWSPAAAIAGGETARGSLDQEPGAAACRIAC